MDERAMDTRTRDALEDVERNVVGVAAALDCMYSMAIHGDEVGGEQLADFVWLLSDALHEQAGTLRTLLGGEQTA